MFQIASLFHSLTCSFSKFSQFKIRREKKHLFLLSITVQIHSSQCGQTLKIYCSLIFYDRLMSGRSKMQLLTFLPVLGRNSSKSFTRWRSFRDFFFSRKDTFKVRFQESLFVYFLHSVHSGACRDVYIFLSGSVDVFVGLQGAFCLSEVMTLQSWMSFE